MLLLLNVSEYGVNSTSHISAYVGSSLMLALEVLVLAEKFCLLAVRIVAGPRIVVGAPPVLKIADDLG